MVSKKLILNILWIGCVVCGMFDGPKNVLILFDEGSRVPTEFYKKSKDLWEYAVVGKKDVPIPGSLLNASLASIGTVGAQLRIKYKDLLTDPQKATFGWNVRRPSSLEAIRKMSEAMTDKNTTGITFALTAAENLDDRVPCLKREAYLNITRHELYEHVEHAKEMEGMLVQLNDYLGRKDITEANYLEVMENLKVESNQFYDELWRGRELVQYLEKFMLKSYKYQYGWYLGFHKINGVKVVDEIRKSRQTSIVSWIALQMEKFMICADRESGIKTNSNVDCDDVHPVNVWPTTATAIYTILDAFTYLTRTRESVMLEEFLPRAGHTLAFELHVDEDPRNGRKRFEFRLLDLDEGTRIEYSKDHKKPTYRTKTINGCDQVSDEDTCDIQRIEKYLVRHNFTNAFECYVYAEERELHEMPTIPTTPPTIEYEEPVVRPLVKKQGKNETDDVDIFDDPDFKWKTLYWSLFLIGGIEIVVFLLSLLCCHYLPYRWRKQEIAKLREDIVKKRAKLLKDNEEFADALQGHDHVNKDLRNEVVPATFAAEWNVQQLNENIDAARTGPVDMAKLDKIVRMEKEKMTAEQKFDTNIKHLEEAKELSNRENRVLREFVDCQKEDIKKLQAMQAKLAKMEAADKKKASKGAKKKKEVKKSGKKVEQKKNTKTPEKKTATKAPKAPKDAKAKKNLKQA